MTKEYLLNLASWLPRSCANGPGTRMVLWVQGCPFRCPSCQNPDFLAFRINQILTVDTVWQVFQQLPDLAGISFSGGEPFAQAVALAELASLVQSAGKTVVCWTGYRLEQLHSGRVKGADDLLQHVDLLIDGLFQKQQSGDDVLRGSRNQELHFLSGRIVQADLKDIPRQEWIVNDALLTYTGFPIEGEE
ncbi:radical SAM protein [Aetokthonos hydrillicola Thurmond2011]|uniref:Anaerobic ribonucleoside-triphosphate reductase-activating protein n=1 Tax=Aetokthonos hydrillicola Thurmond2011 TaxID=2712845 RepID=A0AAP5I0N8_9CYAN|nr:4Fe-4S single cluster domain-containing protein [Aetokthonos hydrillicola]MBO3460176.1 radical SAM protein [Aetokthonos hydrillicola CCALA 1050]MBW4590558.1 radical SAM protein [Aetokthonos hydrillicola CCALA 1050]MDR9893033.1 radical SAM protein [Aetokthonos hydrillicola Thurmond2011]